MAQRARKKARRKKATRSSLQHDSIPRVALGRELQSQITRFGLTQTAIGKIVNDAATQMSRLMTGHFNEFSADRMVRFLLRLGSDVTISIRHAKRLGRRGKVRVRVD